MANGTPAPLIISEDKSLSTAEMNYDDLADSVKTEQTNIETVDKDLHYAWYGNAGNSFYKAYYTLEQKMNNLITRYANAASGLSETNVLFNNTDSDASGNLSITSQNAGSGGH